MAKKVSPWKLTWSCEEEDVRIYGVIGERQRETNRQPRKLNNHLTARTLVSGPLRIYTVDVGGWHPLNKGELGIAGIFQSEREL